MTGNPELLCKNPEVINHNHRFDEENGGFSRMLDKLLGDKKNTPIGKEVYDNAMQKAGEISKNNDSPEDKKKLLKSIYDEVKGNGKPTEQNEFNATLEKSINDHQIDKGGKGAGFKAPDGGQCEAAKPGPKEGPPFPL